MLAVVQRVTSASVTTHAPQRTARIDAGLLVLACAMPDDTDHDVTWMANKIAGLRIFPDADGRMNENVSTVGGQILLVSQFTLAGDCSKGFRPSFVKAAPPEAAKPLVDALGHTLESQHGLTVATGVFGTHMTVDSVNDGPVTLVLQTP